MTMMKSTRRTFVMRGRLERNDMRMMKRERSRGRNHMMTMTRTMTMTMMMMIMMMMMMIDSFPYLTYSVSLE